MSFPCTGARRPPSAPSGPPRSPGQSCRTEEDPRGQRGPGEDACGGGSRGASSGAGAQGRFLQERPGDAGSPWITQELADHGTDGELPDLEKVVPAVVVEGSRAHLVDGPTPVRRRLGNGLLERSRTARVRIRDEEALVVEPRLLGHSEHGSMVAHELTGDRQMALGRPTPWIGGGEHVVE